MTARHATTMTTYRLGCSTRRKFIFAVVAFLVGVSIYTLVYTSFTAVFGPDIIRLHRVALGAEHGDNAHPPSLRSPSLEQHLPPGWASATVASSKRQYYYHAAQNIVQWNRPAPTAPDHLAVTRSNKPSFHHAVFNVTQWNPPPTPAPISTTTQVVTRLVVPNPDPNPPISANRDSVVPVANYSPVSPPIGTFPPGRRPSTWRSDGECCSDSLHMNRSYEVSWRRAQTDHSLQKPAFYSQRCG